MPEEIKDITEEPKKRGRKKKVVEATVEDAAVEPIVAEPIVEEISTDNNAKSSEIDEQETANINIENTPVSDVPVNVSSTESDKVSKNTSVKKNISYVGKKLIANPPIKIHRGPSDAVSAKSFSGQITILSDPVNGWTKVRYTRAAVGAAVGFARLSEAELKRARS